MNHLDCNGDILLFSNDVNKLKRYVQYLREKGINAFLKSSCVNANILKTNNPSEYFFHNNEYCIQCKNCK